MKEYWIVHPIEQTLLIYTLQDGAYAAERPFGKGEIIKSTVLKGFKLDLEEIFRDLG